MVLMHALSHRWGDWGLLFWLIDQELAPPLSLPAERLHQIHFCSSTACPGPYPLFCAPSSLRLQDRQFEIIPSYSSSEQQIASFAHSDPTTSCRPLLTTSRRTRAAYYIDSSTRFDLFLLYSWGKRRHPRRLFTPSTIMWSCLKIAGKDSSDNRCQSGDDDQPKLRRKKGEERPTRRGDSTKRDTNCTVTQPTDDGVYGELFHP